MQQVVRTKQKLRMIIEASKKIRKSENEHQEKVSQKLSIPFVYKKKTEQVEDICHSNKFDTLFYPKEPNQIFPMQLQENIIKIITSFGKSTNIQHIINNLSYFYKNPIDQQLFKNYLAYAEENGIIYERQGLYFVSQELIPSIEPENLGYFQNQVNNQINLNVPKNKEKIGIFVKKETHILKVF